MEAAPVILVTGGAGYIGSHTVLALRTAGHEVIVLDDLSEGHRDALLGTPLIVGSTLDPIVLARVFAERPITAVLHFAARCYVGESVADPGLYYRNNVGGMVALLDAMVAAGVRKLVFSSTCATYGLAQRIPITEDEQQLPVNPYGRSKLYCEQVLRDFHAAHDVDSIALRYFNAAGADPEGRIGEDHAPETHLIPCALRAAMGIGPELTVFGDDYATPDGTCVRDYVHVSDLAAAHVLALDALMAGRSGAQAFNLGNERGTSVREILDTVAAVTGAVVPHVVGPRRAGDPPVLVGSAARIRAALGWQPRFGTVQTIVETAWAWHRAHPGGFDA